MHDVAYVTPATVRLPAVASHGVKLNTPVTGSTVYTPLPGTIDDMPVHPGETCAPVHSFTLVGSNVTPVVTESLPRGFTDCVAPCAPDVESGSAVGSGGEATVGVIVDVTTCPARSVTAYSIGVAVPTKGRTHPAAAGSPAATHGWNATVPSGYTEYTP